MKKLSFFMLAAMFALAAVSCESPTTNTGTGDDEGGKGTTLKQGKLSLEYAYYSLEEGDVLDPGFKYQIDGLAEGELNAEDIEWKSSDSEVVAIEDGQLVALKEGKSRITVTYLPNEALRASMFVSVVPVPVITRCVDYTEEFVEKLGEVYFITDNTYVIGNQEWSDAVQASGSRTDLPPGYPDDHGKFFDGGQDGGETYYPDARVNNDPLWIATEKEYGDLFSWCAVSQYRKTICPDGWRVPSPKDFQALFVAMGGANVAPGEKFVDRGLADRFISEWNVRFGSYCNDMIILHAPELVATYWSTGQRISDAEKPDRDKYGSGFEFNQINGFGTFVPDADFSKRFGFQVRCVRDVK
jgi:uncharacterized protein (TIGR02145 family)